MAYNFTDIEKRLGYGKGTDPKNEYIELSQETFNDQFYNSSNWWTVEEETYPGSALYSNVDVRLSHVINAETGLKLGDDWKTLFFKDVSHSTELGLQYKFDDNVWITSNTEIIKNLTATCTIRRCNNTLRWIDEETGHYYEEPCVIGYLVKEPRDYFTAGSPFMTPGGFLHIEMQFNSRTNKIRQNQRFLFGNPQHWTCYKVIGTGLNDFRNTKTYDYNSARILTLDLIANFVNNELDDVTNGVADKYTNVYGISLNITSFEGIVGSTVQLTPTITYNGDTTTRNVQWSSTNSEIASVSSSGLVTLNQEGSAVISVNIEGNTTSTVCNISVSTTGVDSYEVYLEPSINYILEGKETDYSVYLKKNGVIQSDYFTVSLNSNGVPSENYSFLQTGNNSFKIKNIQKYLSSKLIVTCVTGSHSKTYEILLKGGW